MPIEVSAQLRKGVVEYCVLGLLESEPMYGWRLSEALIGHGMIASIGTLYPVLARLRERGLIAAFAVDSLDASLGTLVGATRKYYGLTSRGVHELVEFRRQWDPFTRSVEILVGKGAQ